jgi:hypothetical protein
VVYEFSDKEFSMKTRIVTSGILGITLVFSLLFTACPTDPDDNKAGKEDVVKEDPETFIDVSGDFPLAAGQTGLNLVSARKSNKTGEITITLGGAITQAADFVALFSPGGSQIPTGNYTYVSFSLVSVLASISDQVIAIRQENDALRYYTTPGSPSLLQTEPMAPIFAGVEPNIYVPESPAMPLKWKANAANVFDGDAAAEMQFIVSSTASPKTIRIDITTWSANQVGAGKTGDVPTIIVDYTGLNIR